MQYISISSEAVDFLFVRLHKVIKTKSDGEQNKKCVSQRQSLIYIHNMKTERNMIFEIYLTRSLKWIARVEIMTQFDTKLYYYVD